MSRLIGNLTDTTLDNQAILDDIADLQVQLTTSVSTLQGNITSEATTRANVDTTLQTSLTTEITNRINSDNALSSNIATNTSNIATNTSAIATNTSNIATNTSNIATNATSITNVQSALSTEITNRVNADNALSSSLATLTTTTTTNTNNIATNTTNLANEITRATNAESLISGNLSTEITRATTKENSLQSAIDAINGRTTLTTDSVDSIGNTLTIAGLNNTQVVNVATGSGVQVVNIGTGSGATTINLGGAGDTVAISGTLANINTTNVDVVDKNITLNKGGLAGSAFDAGLNFEEGGSVTGYVRVSGDRNSITMKAPNSSYTMGLNQSLLTTDSPTFVNVNADVNGNATTSSSCTGNSATATLADTCTTIPTLTGEVSNVGNSVSVVSVGGSIASSINSATILTNNATSSNVGSSIVRRDAGGNFVTTKVFGNLQGNVIGNADTATLANTCTTIPTLTGEVSNVGNNISILSVAGRPASAVSSATALANSASSSNIFSNIVRRDTNGSFVATLVQANLQGNVIGNADTATLANTCTTIPTLTGEVSSSGNAITLSNNAVINKNLSGYVKGAGVVSSSDSVLQAIQKLDGNVSGVSTFGGLSGEASAGANGVTTLNNASVIGKTLTGYVKGAGVVSSSDSILQSVQKLDGNVSAINSFSGLSGEATAGTNGVTTLNNASVINKTLTGYVKGAGVVSPTDTIIQAIQEIDGNTLVPKGTWSSGTTYNVNDVVNYNDGLYVALSANTNINPQSLSNQSVFLSSSYPANVISDATESEMCLTFKPLVNGFVNGCAFYKYAPNNITHVGKLWSSGGTLLSSATFVGETASGMQSQLFGAPVAVVAGTTYVISVNAKNQYEGGGFVSYPFTSGTGNLQGVNSGRNYGVTGLVFPGLTAGGYSNTNFSVDVLFSTGVTWLTMSNPNPLTGDVSSTNTGVATINQVGGSLASAVNTATILANNATNLNTGNQIVRRDASGNFVANNITATLTGTATTCTTIPTLSGEVTNTGNAITLNNASVIGKALTGYVSGAGTITASDTILSAIQKLNANDATNANLTGECTSVGNATTLTNASVIGKVLTGYVSGAGTITATDTILSAIQKLNGNKAINSAMTGEATSNGTTNAVTLTNSAVIGKLLTGIVLTSFANISATDTILVALGKIGFLLNNATTNANNSTLVLRDTFGGFSANVINHTSLISPTGQFRSESVTMPVSSVSSNCVEFAQIVTINGSCAVTLRFNIDALNYSANSTYIFPISWNATGGAWQKLVPVSRGSGNPSELMEIEVKVSSGTAVLRARRYLGTTSATATIDIRINSINTTTYTSPRTINTDVTNVDNYNDGRYAVYGTFNAPNGQGTYLGWNRSATGRTAFANQQGLGSEGGYEWLNYNSSNVLTPASPLMTLDNVGNLALLGSISATNYFYNNTTLTGTWSGGLSASGVVKVSRSGNNVNVSLQPFLVTASNTGNANFSVVLPTWAQPSTNYGNGTGILHPICVYKNGIPDSGLANVSPTTRAIYITTLSTTGWAGLSGMAGGQNISFLVD